MLGGPLPHKGARVADRQGKIKRRQLQLHAAGLNLGKIQDLVNQRQKVAARGENVLRVFSLFLVQLAKQFFPQDFGKPDNGVERGASSRDMLARNSDLCRLAASIWRLLSSISRNSRAFWIANTDWVAKVFKSRSLRGESRQ